MKVLVVGTGYVGATTALIFAEQGHQVTGVDVDEKKIASLRAGKLHFYEEGLEELLVKHLQQQLIFTTDMEKAVQENEMIYICVGTPQKEDGSANLAYVEQVARAIGQYMNGYKTVVTKSTVPVGTAEKVTNWIAKAQTKPYEYDVVSNPEFLREGSALYDALHPDRIVVGASTERAFQKMRVLFGEVNCPYVETEPKASELIKYAANSFLALKISYINELARLCDSLHINVKDVANGMGLDKRIGTSFLGAGIGYGGSCFPKDVNALLNTAAQSSRPLTILAKAVQVNESQTLYALEKMEAALGGWKEKTIAVLGLAFKADTDDMRESPSLKMIHYLLQQGVTVKVHDPVAKYTGGGVLQCASVAEAIQGADAVFLCTDWAEYKQLDWGSLSKEMNQPIVLDGRNCLDAKQLREAGVQYYGLGV
ncbi:UDP-glucose dehydrogenase family protein [Ectobacillus ponti]|uniref:UDP-glucose 6-dehydrogenase n=1 Tax=Ectobacillus ponti TaxID=2961894 RepID=A0AA41X7L3_9BACI|nr:UDP-glucose/GDP-mannose dehydrogenase family protein [Ectobacillus ponti]MCP8968345.1 UDP-glucose/GDP-mannose dehydrogenase family protein [Ectobacillus ponti]